MVITLKVQGVRKAFKKNVVLRDISFTAKSPDIIGLIGKSGCGKSTLLKILVGFHKPDSGTISLDGKNIAKNSMQLRRMVGYVTQENSFYEKLSVAENMSYYASLYNLAFRKGRERIIMLLDKVGLLAHKKTLAGNISGGMKRRLDFAIALLHDPKILILDEPTAGLDPLLIEQFWKVVKEVVSKEEKVVIMSSHIISEIEKHCTKAAVMDQGKVVKVLRKGDMKNLEEKFKQLLGK